MIHSLLVPWQLLFVVEKFDGAPRGPIFSLHFLERLRQSRSLPHLARGFGSLG